MTNHRTTAEAPTSIEIGSGVLFEVRASGRHVMICIDGEPYVFPASIARQIVDALNAAARFADAADR